ncbi:polyprenyl synthetase family protein [Amycolatopsis sp. NPDC051045]|uniref:polyprenyl synthetase family protein n=1 Tax=Amycolatopsis sp. NPDC051045 TaxID=3156922 RepID=UPI003422380A
MSRRASSDAETAQGGFGNGVAGSVDAVLAEFLADQVRKSARPQVGLFAGWLRECLVGGKRLRPVLCWCGWVAAGAHGDPAGVVRVAASLELFHAFALIQDDVMDGSDTRRGRPAMHRQIARLHAGHPAAQRLGEHVAILLGDLAFGWSYELLHTAGLDPDRAAAAWSLLNAMRTETLAGQYLDLVATGRGHVDLDTALRVARAKTAVYTVEYPLRVGAALGDADQNLHRAFTAYGVPLGEAFQLRDDLLGVFGDPARTGKPILDDLRSGKPTALLAIAHDRADSAQCTRLGDLVGHLGLDEDGAAEVRSIFTATGAHTTVEHMITQRCRQAAVALDSAPLHTEAAAFLRSLITHATSRDR